MEMCLFNSNNIEYSLSSDENFQIFAPKLALIIIRRTFLKIMSIPKQVKSYAGEEWCLVKTSHPFRVFKYYFSNFGRMKSFNPHTNDENLIKGSIGRKGFVKLNLKLKDNKREGFYLHQLIAKTFIKNDIPEKIFVIHKDNVKSNNHHNNLQWMSREEMNVWMRNLPSVKNKKRTFGANVKLNPSSVAILKKHINQKRTKLRILAKQFDISYTQLKRIERGENWGHVQAAK